MNQNENFATFWEATMAGAPTLFAEKRVTISSDILRRLCELAHNAGFVAGKRDAKEK